MIGMYVLTLYSYQVCLDAGSTVPDRSRTCCGHAACLILGKLHP
jgi:hypothetical protein